MRAVDFDGNVGAASLQVEVTVGSDNEEQSQLFLPTVMAGNAEPATSGPFFDPDETTWASVRGYTSAQFSNHFSKISADHIFIDIEVDEINGQQRVSGVWQYNSDNRDWSEQRNLTTTEFHDWLF